MNTTKAELEGQARRIVAALHACEGISTEALEREGPVWQIAIARRCDHLHAVIERAEKMLGNAHDADVRQLLRSTLAETGRWQP